MSVMVRVGAVHLGWDVVSVAAGGSGVPIRPVQVEGSYNPPAYLLADASGRLFTAGADKQRPDLGMAIPDVREILGHRQIVIAGATWPAELVFRARLYNPLAAVGTYLRGKPDVVALPYPDDWPDPKIDAYAQLVEQLDVEVEPIPESIALSGYVRALGLVRPPEHNLPDGVGATAVHFDGRVVDGRANVLVVAVHGDDERPTESVYVEIDPESIHNPRVADDTVIEVMAAARAIGADNSTVLLAGQVVFNETMRFAFRNHLGQRLRKAEHPMHALVLGATHLLVSENEDDDEEGDPGSYSQPPPPGAPPAPGNTGPSHPISGANHAVPGGPPDRNPAGGSQWSVSLPDSPSGPGPRPPAQQFYGSRSSAPAVGAATFEADRGALLPPIPGPADRFTRAPDPETGNQPVAAPRTGSEQPGRRDERPPGQSRADSEYAGEQAPGKLWNKMKDNLFGAQAVLGAAVLAAALWGVDGARTAHAVPDPAAVVRSVTHSAGAVQVREGTAVAPVSHDTASCVPIPYVRIEPPAGSDTTPQQQLFYARELPGGSGAETAPEQEAYEAPADECGQSGIDNLRYRVPGLPGITDPGPPISI